MDDARTHDMRTSGEPVREVAEGDDIGGYIVDGELGVGGMGVVYSAVHPVIGKRAAIKVLRAELNDDPESVGRFIREAQLVNQIHHPNIIDIFAIGRLDSGQYYLVMDLLEGETLRDRLRRGTLSLAEAASVLDEMAAALIAAHDKGIIHRDLKPDNVFLVASAGRWPAVKLLDFGVAKLLRAGPTPVSLATQTGIALGTPWYMSPEQARGKSVDHRTDIYALGVMAYEVFTGVRPFHVIAEGGSLADAAAGAPEDLVRVIETMISDDADQRPTLALVRAAIKRARRTLDTDEVVGPATNVARADAVRTIVDRWPTTSEDDGERPTTQLPTPVFHTAPEVRISEPAMSDAADDEAADATDARERTEHDADREPDDDPDYATTLRPSQPAFLEAATTVGLAPPPAAARPESDSGLRTPVTLPRRVAAASAVPAGAQVAVPVVARRVASGPIAVAAAAAADAPEAPVAEIVPTHTEIVRIQSPARLGLALLVLLVVGLGAVALGYLLSG